MRILTLPVVIIFLFSCTHRQSEQAKKPEAKTVSSVNDSKRDTTYKVDDFLILCNKGMPFDFIKNDAPPKKRISKGDTLFNDEEFTILGDNKECSPYGIYKKFNFKSQYSDYAVDKIYSGKLAMVNLKTNANAYEWRTRLREGCRYDSVNFAGHYTIVQWGCGTECVHMGVVDRITGHVYLDFPFQEVDGYYGCEFRRDSKMLIINSFLFQDYKGYRQVDFRNPEAYVWTGNNFKRIE